MRQRTSQIWLIDREELQNLIDNSSTIGEVLNYFGLENKGGNFKTLNERIKFDNLNLNILSENRKKSRAEKVSINRREVSLEDVFSGNKSYKSTSNLKDRLIKEGLLENRCSICKLDNNWQNKPLSLHLDHIDGNRENNSLSNLRLLCPNCHSQTSTYAGKKRRSIDAGMLTVRSEHLCTCGNKIYYSKSRLCKKCASKINGLARRKVERPNRDMLFSLVKEHGYVAVGRMYNVSDNAIRKWLR